VSDVGLLTAIQHDIVNGSVSTATSLRKAQILAYQLDNLEFKNWVDWELNGYPANAKTFDEILQRLPAYRIAEASILFNAVDRFGGQYRNVTLRAPGLPPEHRLFYSLEGIPTLEKIAASEGDVAKVILPAYLVHALNQETISKQWAISEAWKQVPKGILINIIETVRNRLLKFTLELTRLYPGLNSDVENAQTITDAEQVTFLVQNHILVARGGNLSIFSQKGGATMPKYQLTEQQKNLLRSLVPGLRSGQVKSDWAIVSGNDRILGIFGLDDDGQLWRDTWDGVKYSDLEVFEGYGFFKHTRTDKHGIKTNYALNEAAIIEAVENDFEMPAVSSAPQSTISIHASGSIVNIQSTLDNVSQVIHNAPQLDDNFKAELTSLIEQLTAALTEVPDEYAEDAEAIAVEASRLAEDVSRAKPNRRSIQISADGLKRAAQNLAAITPPVVTIVQSIVELVQKVAK